MAPAKTNPKISINRRVAKKAPRVKPKPNLKPVHTPKLALVTAGWIDAFTAAR